MKKRLILRYWTHWKTRLVFLSISISGLILAYFQNCADPLEIAGQDSQSYNNQLPFAFDTQIDTIAYMSCSDTGTNYDPRSFFSFRVGAYGPGSGIRLTSDFLAATKNFTSAQKVDSLSASEKNAEATLQLGIRLNNDLQSMLSGSETAQENRDFSHILAPLNSTLIAQKLVGLQGDQRINYFSGASGLEGRLVEGSIRFMDTEAIASSMRNSLRDSGLLTLTYTGSNLSDSTAVRYLDDNDKKKAYGRGYQVDFRMGLGIELASSSARPIFTKGIHRVINSIQEVDLLKRSASEADIRPWSCPTENSFIVVRSEDITAAKVNCARTLDPLTPTEKDRASLTALRRVLRVEDWWIDLERRCIIPKSTDANCYGTMPTTTTPPTVKYDGGDCTANGFLCPHYVSVCVRQ